MVIDHAHRLHQGVAGGWSDKAPAPSLQFLTQGGRLDCFGSDLVSVSYRRRSLWLETPEKSCQGAEFVNQFCGAMSIVDGGFDFSTVSNDTRVGHQLIDFL